MKKLVLLVALLVLPALAYAGEAGFLRGLQVRQAGQIRQIRRGGFLREMVNPYADICNYCLSCDKIAIEFSECDESECKAELTECMNDTDLTHKECFDDYFSCSCDDIYEELKTCRRSTNMKYCEKDWVEDNCE